MDEFIQTIIKELGCNYMGPDMIGDEEDHKDYIIDQIKKLKEDNPGYETVEKLDKEFSELWDEKEEVKDELLEMEKERNLWWKEYHDLREEFKFMICYHKYNNTPNDNDMQQLLFELPHQRFWEDDFHHDFSQFIDDIVKNSEHKEF